MKMKRRILSALLTLSMVIALVPTSVFGINAPAEKATDLGTDAEYKTTFDTFFDRNGLRKVETGWQSNSGVLNNKVGFVNKSGDFVVQPIYDKIQLESSHPLQGDDSTQTVLPTYFVGGYTQAVRDGKMGLLNTRGEEVIPCQYDFVGLPSEGVSRVLNKKDADTYYLGYWNLTQKKEIVAPDKYVTIYKNKVIGNKTNDADPYKNCKQKPDGDFLAYHDFNGGYAMVYANKKENNKPHTTVIDKNGKNIYGKTYLTNQYITDYTDYPQQGPYLSYIKAKTFKNYRFQKLHDSRWVKTQTFKTYVTGLVGPKGIAIPASYSTGVLASAGEATFGINPAKFEIILDKKLILTQKDAKPGYLYGGAYGVIDFSGKTVLPFAHSVNQELYYHAKDKVFTSLLGTLYNLKGKRLHDTSYEYSFFRNGSAKVVKTGKFNKKTDTYDRTLYFGNSNGSLLNLSKLLKLPINDRAMKDRLSDASTEGYFWAQNKQGKWGLLNFKGKTILSFQYDKVGHGNWAIGANGFATVTKNGKLGMVNAKGVQVLPCSYSRITAPESNSPNVIVTDSNKKNGVAVVKTGKFLIPVKYDKISAFASFEQPNITLFDTGVCYAEKDGKALFIDKTGKEVFSTDKKFYEALEGLYRFSDNSGYFDNRGRIIVPGELWRPTNPELGASYTIYAEKGKVSRISSNYIESTYKFKSIDPSKSASDSYAKTKRDEAAKAAKQAAEDPYQPKPIYKEPFAKFVSVPDKILYNVGDPFETAGFKVLWMDIYGKGTDITADIELKVNGSKIQNGYIFKEAGEKTVDCYYEGKKLSNFKVSVVSQDQNLLADGDYNISIYGNYLRVMDPGGFGWIELQNTKPAQKFTVKLIKVDASRGPLYTIKAENGNYVMQPSSRDGAQLKTGPLPHQWRINQYSSFCTIRDYGNQKLIVNASGEQSKNGTKVIVWSHTGKAPDNAKLVFTKVK